MVEMKKHNCPGRLIAVEGLDGSGKSTQNIPFKKMAGTGRP